MPRDKTQKPPVPISSLKHADTRANIPTEELRDFVVDDEAAPKTMLYPRDPSLDPQLVWRGKDEQDAQDLSVPVVPVYIQEKIQPQAIIENVRASSPRPDAREGGVRADQLSLFADYNGISFEQMIDFYRHEQHWANRMILGDSLLVMTSLAEKEGLKGQVQMIYLDPPYGIKFGSNWQVSTRKRDVKDGKAEDATRQPEQIKAFRDTWELAIHSYLAYLRDRLTVARELLTESGSIFVQIGDENVHLVRCAMDEVFGSENAIAEIVVAKTAGASMEFIDCINDYILWYAKNRENTKHRQLFLDKRMGKTGLDLYKFIELPNGERRLQNGDESTNIDSLPDGHRIFRMDALTSQTQATTTRYKASFQGLEYESGKRQWATPPRGMERLIKANRVREYASSIGYIRYYDDFPVIPIRNYWGDTGTGSFTDPKVYVVQTNTKIVERCLLMTTDPGDLVLDPTCGSGTTAYMAEEWGRRWITIDTSRVAVALARTRLMAARYPYYLLLDSAEGARKEAELAGRAEFGQTPGTAYMADVKKGFVYRRVPHITLKSIANNEEIDAIHDKCQARLEPLRAELNRLLGQTWEEWQIPRDEGAKWPARASQAHAEWWRLRRERQAEIDASIARHGDTDLLYDQPYEDAKRIRVSGPFTVESLSPHRVLATDQERPASETEGRKGDAAGQFIPMIIANLRAAGVQNTVKQERLKFDRLEPYAGAWLHATGEYTEADGKTKRVAVSIGPEHGTVGPEQVKEAAKEAVQGVGHDLLAVCGFAFDPHVSEEAKRYGRLTVLTARMNPDLAMGDALLKKTGAGNLFMVFGEPDLEVTQQPDGKLVVEIKGVDVYDPTTGQIRSSSTDDIACWFIDTDYNGESFFVRHAYFTGAGDPYERLKRALRAEVDEAAWSRLYSTVSYPFGRPSTGKIAVKVINHYGDEVLKVYSVGDARDGVHGTA